MKKEEQMDREALIAAGINLNDISHSFYQNMIDGQTLVRIHLSTNVRLTTVVYLQDKNYLLAEDFHEIGKVQLINKTHIVSILEEPPAKKNM